MVQLLQTTDLLVIYTEEWLVPTLKTISDIGGSAEKGRKMITKEEVFPMYVNCKASKDQGGFHVSTEQLFR